LTTRNMIFAEESHDSVSVEKKLWSAESSSFPTLARGLPTPDRVSL
jgi:hypothetical protein